MTPEEALKVAEDALRAAGKPPLKDIQRMILRESLAGKGYEQMEGYATQHIKNVGNKLWDELSKALGEKVNKKSFKWALEKRLRSTEISPKPASPEQRSPENSSPDFTRTPDPVIQPNPFSDTGRIDDPKRFFGRKALLHQLFEGLGTGGNRSLVGEAKVGKSSILQMICKLGPERLHLPQKAFIYLDMRNVYNEQDFFEAFCYELEIEPCRGYHLWRVLRGNRYILCLDEIDNMVREEHFTGDERTELCGLADGADMPLTLVTASQKPLKDLFPDSPIRTSPLAGICMQIPAFLTSR